jgi:lipoyl synthase
MKNRSYQPKPDWLRIKLPKTGEYSYLKTHLSKYNLHTICESGNCPNIGECWEKRTATFMILGDVCTRSCRFCAVKTGKPMPADADEPGKIAEVVKLMGLKHCVLTSVDRDDLEDGGASHWAKTINAIKSQIPGITIEALIPDFNGNTDNINTVIKAKPDILSHNLETVERLTKKVRIFAKFETSLNVLKHISKNGITSKSGIMLGLGENYEEIEQTMERIRKTGCSILTIGQYLQPTREHLPVEKYYTPDEFQHFKKVGLSLGFRFVESGPLVRSSYHAEEQLCCTTDNLQKTTENCTNPTEN